MPCVGHGCQGLKRQKAAVQHMEIGEGIESQLLATCSPGSGQSCPTIIVPMPSWHVNAAQYALDCRRSSGAAGGGQLCTTRVKWKWKSAALNIHLVSNS